MRRHKYLIGGSMAVVAALTFSGLASSLPTGLTLQTTYSPSKEDKKKFAGATLHLHQEFEYDAFGASRSPRQMVFTFPKDVKLVPGNVPVCPLSQIRGKLEPAARAACQKSILAEGSL